MDDFETGTVVHIGTDKNGLSFGFLELENGESMFFHFNDGRDAIVTSSGPDVAQWRHSREPRKGDLIVFRRHANQKGFQAKPWCLNEDLLRVEDQIEQAPVYRLMRQTSRFRVKGDPKSIWEGWYIPDLCDRHGHVAIRAQESSDGSGGHVRHWFERQATDGTWHPLPEGEDPRKIPIEQKMARPMIEPRKSPRPNRTYYESFDYVEDYRFDD